MIVCRVQYLRYDGRNGNLGLPTCQGQPGHSLTQSRKPRNRHKHTTTYIPWVARQPIDNTAIATAIALSQPLPCHSHCHCYNHCPMALARPPLARLGFSASTASVWRTSATLAPPTCTPPSSFSSPPLARAALLSRHLSTSSSTMSYSIRKIAQPFTLEHRVYIEKDGQIVSPFHDIPLYANAEKTILNMVVEIPRWTNAKQEVRFLPFLSPFRTAVMLGISGCINPAPPTHNTDCDIALDLQGGLPQPHQAGYQEGQAPLRP